METLINKPIDPISQAMADAQTVSEFDQRQAATPVESVDRPEGVITLEGRDYIRNAKGHLVPVSTVQDSELLEDQTVRKILSFATPLASQVARFRQHCFDDVDALIDLLSAQYGVKKGGQKGNLTLMSFDNLQKVTVQIGETLAFGPQLQAAKTLIDECLKDWSEHANENLVAIVDNAFQVDKEGQISRSRMFGRLRHKSEDVRWNNAMQAVKDSMRVVGTKRYVRTYYRSDIMAPWQSVVIDAAAS
jgi:hypothetical protein